MGPARKHRPDIEPDIRPDLHVIEGGGESTPERGELSAVNNETGARLAGDERRLGVLQGGGESTSGRGNLAAVRDQEETSANQYGYTPSGGSKKTKQTFSLKGGLKKKGPLGLLLGIIFGGVGGLTMLISPGIAVVQLKEILTDDLNDQLTAMDIRSTYVLRAKLNDMGTGICRGVTIKCSYKGFSDRQLKKFQAAGIEVETDGRSRIPPNRHKVKSLTFKQTVGLETRELKATNPAQLNKLLGERVVRENLRRAFNPKFAGFQDKVSASVFSRFKTNKGDKLGSGSNEERDKAVSDAVRGDPIGASTPGNLPTDGEDQATNTENEKANEKASETASRLEGDGAPVKSLFGSGLSSAVKGVGVLGIADTACTVKNTLRAVEAGAKIYRKRQLIAYAMVFLSFADQVKAGTATPEQAEYVGNKLTAIDTDEQVVDETSEFNGGAPKKVKNPYYGKNAFDSPGYKTAMYNDAPTLTARDMQFTLGGATMGTLASINKFVAQHADGVNCKVVQNPLVRGGSFVVGIALAIGTAGTATMLSIGGSVAIGLALPILENYLSQMLAGNIVGGGTKGVDAGNAIFAGSSAMMGEVAMDRGMKPATKSDLKEYLALSDEIRAEYIAMETEAAKDTPFDIYNQHSFLGSLTRTLLPFRTASTASVGGSLVNAFNLIPLASASLAPSAYATNGYNEDRFSKCSDYGYDQLGIDADVFCNVRYTMSKHELGLDSDKVIDWMASNKMINPEDGSAQNEYQDWLSECTTREAGWGEEAEENGPTGINCMNSADRGGKSGDFSDQQLSYFRVYTMDKSVFEAMDYEPPLGNASLSGGSEFRIASFNVLGTSHTDGPGANKPSFSSWSERIKRSQEVITSNNLEIIGFQEFEPSQRNYLKKNLPNYEMSSQGKLSDSIMWSSDRFELVSQGTWQSTYFGGKIQEPWVKLKDRETQQEFYVMNVHDPINRGQGDAETRYQNALGHLRKVNEFKTQAPVFLVGDFNSAFSRDNGAGAKTDQKLTYCVLTAGGMNNAYDLSVPRPAKCPNKPKGVRNYIDHIYLTPEVEVSSFKEVSGGDKSNGSDHPTIFADIVIPGTGENSGAGTDFVIGTYNQPVRGNEAVAGREIKNRKFDVVGMQELAGANYTNLRRDLGQAGYGVYPDWNKNYDGFCSSGRAVFYNKTKFRLVKAEVFNFPSDRGNRDSSASTCANGESHPDGRANSPILWLEDIRSQYKGQKIIVINTHNAAFARNAERRYQAALIYVQQVTRLKRENPGVPIFFTGDFNEGTAVRKPGMGANLTYEWDKPSGYKNLLYCMFANNKLMKAVNKPNSCPNPAGRTPVDFIYYTPGVKVEWHKEFIDPSTNDSPHPVMYARMVVPGSKDGSSSQPGSDIVGDDYARECGKYTTCTKQCVDFVKFRLLKHGVLKQTRSLGNGKDVVRTLGSMGYKVNKTPAVHAVMSTAATSTPQWGHTAMVSAVLANGSIIVEEYNYTRPLAYGKRLITASEIKAKNITFAHTEVDYK